MRFFGARSQREQYIPRKGTNRPGWSYRGARRNAARLMHWPERYRWRVWLAETTRLVKEKMKGLVPATA